MERNLRKPPVIPPKPRLNKDAIEKITINRIPSANHLYSNMKETLDNSLLLDQQLEALAYHKKVLERQRDRREYENVVPFKLDLSIDNVHDIEAPASPVSSSYSELRRAAERSPEDDCQTIDYVTFNYDSISSAATYESIYEPINPPCVDDITQFINKSLTLEEFNDFGQCYKCGERIIDDTSGCTAMEQLYHIKCFTCCQCQINLQGKPFYSYDGQPCCESDYLNTLEKCCVCMRPILERILRATGKPYHPGCFCCCVCGKSLDGVPFTVDATNQNHCIDDFHKKFAPRCCVCKQPIMPEIGKEETVRVVALDRSFHINCYKCEDCGLILSSETEGRGCFPLDDHILCKECNAKRVQALTKYMTTEL